MNVPFAMSLDEVTLDRLAEALAERVAPRVAAHLRAAGTVEVAGWLSTRDAARYLGITTNALHKITGARAIAFSQDGPGAACYFRRADLDAYREASMHGP